MKIHGASLVINQDSLAYRGALAIELVLGGQLDLSVPQVIKLIDDNIIGFKITALPLVIFDARSMTDFDKDDAREVALLLKQRGFPLIAKLDGMNYPAFAEYAAIVSAYVDSDWLNYVCHEIIYVPRSDDKIKLPFIYPVVKQAHKAVLLRKKRNAQEIYDALSKNESSWAIITPPLFDYSVKLL